MSDRKNEREWGGRHEGYGGCFEIMNISCKPSHPCLLRKKKKEETWGGNKCSMHAAESESLVQVLFSGSWQKKKPYLEIRQANLNWIKSIWILLSVLFFFPTVYTVLSSISCDGVMGSMHYSALCKNTPELRYRFRRCNNWAANAEQWRSHCCNLCQWKCIYLKGLIVGGGVGGAGKGGTPGRAIRPAKYGWVPT